MRRKSFMFMMLLSGIMVGICGCESKQSTQTEEIPEEIASNTADSSGPVNLVLWGAEDDQEMLGMMIQSFQEHYAGEASINVELGVQSESDCKEVVLADVEASADVFAFADDQLRTFVAAGALSPVENIDEIKSSNVEGAVSSSMVNDKLYAYPMTADNGYFLHYNKAYLSDEDVKTLDGILTVASENDKKVTMDLTSGWYSYSFFGQTGLEMGLNADGVTNYCNWNATDTAIKGVDVAQAMLDITANPGFLCGGDTELLEGAREDSVIAGISGVWSATELEKIWGKNYGAVKLPTYTCAGKQVQMASFAGYKMLGVNAYSAHVEWAHKLAEWITNEENQMLRFEMRGQGPSNIKAEASDEIAASEAIQAVIAQSEYATLQRIGSSYWDPMIEFGILMRDQNPGEKKLQDIMDDLVAKITAAKGM